MRENKRSVGDEGHTQVVYGQKRFIACGESKNDFLIPEDRSLAALKQ
jgi:hypothetical protein